MATRNERQPDALGWASRELDCEKSGLSHDARQRLLAEITRGGFLLLPNRDAALRVMNGMPEAGDQPVANIVWLEESARLEAAVDQFAANFFTRSRNERRLEIRSLLAQAEFAPIIVSRINRIATGVEVEIDQSVSTSATRDGKELADELMLLFVCPARERKDRTRHYAAKWAKPGTSARRMLRTLLRSNTNLAALAPKPPRIEVRLPTTQTGQPQGKNVKRNGSIPQWRLAFLLWGIVMVFGIVNTESRRNSNPSPSAPLLPEGFNVPILQYVTAPENGPRRGFMDSTRKANDSRRTKPDPTKQD
jgi:hypothetical protein